MQSSQVQAIDKQINDLETKILAESKETASLVPKMNGNAVVHDVQLTVFKQKQNDNAVKMKAELEKLKFSKEVIIIKELISRACNAKWAVDMNSSLPKPLDQFKKIELGLAILNDEGLTRTARKLYIASLLDKEANFLRLDSPDAFINFSILLNKNKVALKEPVKTFLGLGKPSTFGTQFVIDLELHLNEAKKYFSEPNKIEIKNHLEPHRDVKSATLNKQDHKERLAEALIRVKNIEAKIVNLSQTIQFLKLEIPVLDEKIKAREAGSSQEKDLVNYERDKQQKIEDSELAEKELKSATKNLALVKMRYKLIASDADLPSAFEEMFTETKNYLESCCKKIQAEAQQTNFVKFKNGRVIVRYDDVDVNNFIEYEDDKEEKVYSFDQACKAFKLKPGTDRVVPAILKVHALLSKPDPSDFKKLLNLYELLVSERDALRATDENTSLFGKKPGEDFISALDSVLKKYRVPKLSELKDDASVSEQARVPKPF